jgi:hypothetical protein
VWRSPLVSFDNSPRPAKKPAPPCATWMEAQAL